MDIEKGNLSGRKDNIVPTLQEQRNFLLLWEKLTSSQKNAIEKLIEAMAPPELLPGLRQFLSPAACCGTLRALPLPPCVSAHLRHAAEPVLFRPAHRAAHFRPYGYQDHEPLHPPQHSCHDSGRHRIPQRSGCQPMTLRMVFSASPLRKITKP